MARHEKKTTKALVRMMTRICSDQTTHARRQITQHCLLIIQGMSVKTFPAEHEPLPGAQKKLKLHPPLNGQKQLSLHRKLDHLQRKKVVFIQSAL